MRPERVSLVWPVLLVLGTLAALSERQCFLLDDKLKAVHRFRLCRFPGGYNVLKPGRANRLDFCCAGRVGVFDTFSAQTVVNRGNHPCRHEYGDELDIPCYL